jgi:hypothetical protein
LVFTRFQALLLAFKHLIIQVGDASNGTHEHAQAATHTQIIIDLYHIPFTINGISKASSHTGGVDALLADNGLITLCHFM